MSDNAEAAPLTTLAPHLGQPRQATSESGAAPARHQRGRLTPGRPAPAGPLLAPVRDRPRVPPEPAEGGETPVVTGPVAAPPGLARAQFERIRSLVYDLCGLMLPEGKESLVQARLSKRLRALGLASFDDYLACLAQDRERDELSRLVDAMTTNKTSFFRDAVHFAYLRDTLLPAHHDRRLRIWSAGCSSGEEPYSLAMVLCETWRDAGQRDIRILGTDISTEVLRTAKEARYDEDAMRDVPAALRGKYFTALPGRGADGRRRYRVNDDIRALVRLARLNLMGEWPMRGPLDVIFCRNVMIYFDRSTRERLLRRYCHLLRPGGHLFVGLSESLTSLDHGFRYVQPAVYVRVG